MTAGVGDRWLTIREAAALVGTDMQPQRMRRRLKALHAQRPELGLIRRPGSRWFEVSAEALQRALTTDPDLRETDLDAIASRQNQQEDRQKALRSRQNKMQRQLSSLESRLSALEISRQS